MAKIIPGLWFSIFTSAAAPATPPRPAARDLAALVRAFRQSPTPARRSAVQSFAASHGRENSGLLARLALGIVEYEQRDYPAAIADLGKIEGNLAPVADYAAYYRAAALVESGRLAEVPRELAGVSSAPVPSPMSSRAWILEARALADQPAEAVRLLREHYADLPQPEGGLALADACKAAADLTCAVEYYQGVYYRYLSGAAADRAAAALSALKTAMGGSYPQPPADELLLRASRLMEAREYDRARAEYLQLPDRLTGLDRDEARVGIGAADLFRGRLSEAIQYLRALVLPDSEFDAERLYYLEECARRSGNDAGMQEALDQLANRYPKSTWRLKALASAANRFLLVNQPAYYIPLYRAAYELFPDAPAAGLYHWKVAFHAYMQSDSDAEDLLREHLVRYPDHATAGAALYFLSRQAERRGQFGAARAWYRRLSSAFPNTYYGMLARERLQDSDVASAPSTPEAEQFAAGLRFPPAAPVPVSPSQATTLRIERSRLLRAAGLSDLADAELRFGARSGGQSVLLGLEIANHSDAPNQAMRILKSMAPDYLRLPVNQAPRKLWETLFPLPYRTELERYARQRQIDPFLLAGLIRQESEFDAKAVSPAKAYGLTQVRPATGRIFARKVGIARFTSRSLFQPAINLNIGCSIFRSMLDQHGGKIEQTLAAYNAGPSRAADWITWNTYREPAEFVESIPFTETREYVQAVLRNADLYRRLYR